VLFDVYVLEEWHYARQKCDDSLTSNELWYSRAFKRYVRRERHVRKVLFRQPVAARSGLLFLGLLGLSDRVLELLNCLDLRSV
jgi:hypothetical protein